MRTFRISAGALLWAVVPAFLTRASTGEAITHFRPNIVIVLADQWRAQALGYSGDVNVKTPHLDTLRQQSVSFTNAVASVPVCCPARASLLTGTRALSHGVFLNDVPLDPEAASLPMLLREAGYETAYIGKWHLDGHGRSAFIPVERRHGFTYWKALECTHNYNRSAYYGDGPEKQFWEGYDAIAQTRDAQRYLRTHAENSRKPFFLFLAWGPPHDPYQTAPERFRALYNPEKLQIRANVPEGNAKNARTALAGYYAHCTALDDCMGELLRTLQETGLEDNTILIFTSDHGDLLGSHGGFNKQQPYDESIRVPLLIRWPRGLGRSARQLNPVFSTEDLMPTVLGLCRLPVPGSVEGIDYSGLLQGGGDPSDGSTLISCIAPFGQWERRHGGREYRGIRTTRYTYVRDLSGPWLLFDNQADPFQTNNLVNAANVADLRKKLEAILAGKLKATADEFRPGDFYIKKWGYTVDSNGTVPYAP